ncbi:MAG: hypothetical protein R3F43_00265 [bacterium]
MFYAALYLSVLRLGHEAPPALALLALGLSNLVLFTTVAIDFASPPWRAMASPTPTSSGCWPAGPCAASPSAPCSVSPVIAGWVVIKLELAPTWASPCWRAPTS